MFVDENKPLLAADPCWDNYELIACARRGAEFHQFKCFDEKGLNLADLEKTMKEEIKITFNPGGKKVWKNRKVKGIITAFDGKSVIDIKFEDEPELTKQYSIQALW